MTQRLHRLKHLERLVTAQGLNEFGKILNLARDTWPYMTDQTLRTYAAHILRQQRKTQAGS